MIAVPVPTVEKPITAIDYIAVLAQCITEAEVSAYEAACPPAIQDDERFTKAVSARLGEIKGAR